MSGEEGGEETNRKVTDDGAEEDKRHSPSMTTTSRGFSGAPKFSEFRRTVTSTNTTTTNQSSHTKEGSKDPKAPVAKARDVDDIDSFKEQFEARKFDMSAVDEETDDEEHGILGKISEKLSSVKQEMKDIALEVKEFYERSIKGQRDP